MDAPTGGRDDGASLAEVALIVALVAIAAVAALQFVGSSSETSLDTAGQGIDKDPEPSEGSGGGGSGGSGSGGGSGGGSSGGGSGGGGTPTSTSAPATTAPPAPTTTTTTAPPTTTTTAPPPAPASASLDNGRGERSGYSRWTGSADIELEGDPGVSLSGTATVRVRWWNAYGQWSSETIEVDIGPDGTAEISTGPYNRTGSSRITTIEYTLIDVEFDGDGTWDGDQPSVSIDRPG